MGVKQRHVPAIQKVQKTVVQQRQVPSIQKVQRTVEVPQVQYIDKVVDVPVVKQRHVPSVQKVQKPVTVPVIETVEKVVDVPVIKQVEVPQVQTVAGATRSVNLPSAPVRQTAPAEVVQVTEVGPPLPAESAPATRSQAPMAAVGLGGGSIGGFGGVTYGAAGVGSTNDDGGRGSSRDHDHGCTSDHGSTHGDRGARSTFGNDIRRAAHLLVNGTSAGDQHEGCAALKLSVLNR